MTDSDGVIYFPLFLIALRAIGEAKSLNGQRLGRVCNMSYTHVTKTREALLKAGLIHAIRNDRRSYDMSLTEKGEKVVYIFRLMLNELKITDVHDRRLNAMYCKKYCAEDES